MTKGQGYTTIGAILLAIGMVLRGAFNSVPATGSDKVKDTRPSTAKAVVTEGPWIASCRYWAAVSQGSSSSPSPKVGVQVIKTATGFEAMPTESPNAKSDCGSDIDKWGIPKSTQTLEIHAIIASIPDPIHSHLALESDRMIDSVLQAAADNHYLSSAYWLPWRSPSTAVFAPQSSEIDQAADREREEQPGLIILKYIPDRAEPNFAAASFYRVVYLFLVGESPALGINGTQLQNALRYEEALRKSKEYHAALSMDTRNDTLAFIGPHQSGSAASLRQALLSAIASPPPAFIGPHHTGSAASLRHAPLAIAPAPPSRIIAAGTTSTPISQLTLNECEANSKCPISYLSFGEDSEFEENRVIAAIRGSQEDAAILVEDNTVFGAANVLKCDPVTQTNCDTPYQNATPAARFQSWLSGQQESPRRLYIRFPRDISRLRNAETEQANGSPSQAPSPYLNLSLKDPSAADDTISQFSTTQTPLSQEAQLMAIERQLQKRHVRYILISASNTLDEIFLAHELRRACPNATIVFYNGGDLMVERDVDNIPYIGSITVTPYSLLNFEEPSSSRRLFPSSLAVAYYNAASYIFWWGTKDFVNRNYPMLAGSYTVPHPGFSPINSHLQFPLIATAVGSDGYYPLGILSPCAGDSKAILPDIWLPDVEVPHMSRCLPSSLSSYSIPASVAVRELPSKTPSMFWYMLNVFLIALCLCHIAALKSASYWSPFTRDLAISQNDQPRRRAVYLHIGTSMLASMAIVLTVPWFSVARVIGWYGPATATACVTVASGVIAVFVTLEKTKGYRLFRVTTNFDDQVGLYPWFNWMAVGAVVLVLGLMVRICKSEHAFWGTSYAGFFFSYRCLHPISGVSPVVPVLLLLLAWYLWAMFQTARLRFSSMDRPRLPNVVKSTSLYPIYVDDSSLDRCEPPLSCCLIDNINSLLITRELAHRFTKWPYATLNWALALFYFVVFVICAVGMHIQSLDRFLYPGRTLTTYEWLIAIFFYPLVMIALAGWLRVLLIWSELKDGLLEPLERMPFRLAFSRLCDVDWVTMLVQSGLNVRWRDMARSAESLRQLMNNPEISAAAGYGKGSLKEAYDNLQLQIRNLLGSIHGDASVPIPQQCALNGDLPHVETRRELCFISTIESAYATFCERLLEYILIPYWNDQRIGFVNELGPDSPGTRHVADAPQEPLHIRLAEEFLAIRYVAFIRAVLVNIRHLMLFVSVAFVLAIVAWNSYPFQPRQLLDWCFTILMVCLSVGFIVVFAQMHRNPILSRITSTTPNELGTDFYIHLLTFGGIPVLTWFAYQVPEIGGSLFRLLQPSLQVAK